MKAMQRTLSHLQAGLTLAAIAAATLIFSPAAGASTTAAITASTTEFRDLRVEVVGQGRPVLMIPGLNSAATTWTETCTALQPAVQCHLVQLPGFAGAPARKSSGANEPFLERMREQLLAYVEARQLEKPVLMGHSLGGVLALMMAAERPQLVERLVIVDSLPFLAGLRGMTPEAARAMAAGMRQQMQNSSPEQWEAGARQGSRGMSRDPANNEKVLAWSLASDRQTSAQAMSELWGGDLRPLLPRISAPTLVLGAWAAFEPMGSTREGTQRLFEQQYAGLAQTQVRISERGYHFLMWDDRDWLVSEVKGFLALR